MDEAAERDADRVASDLVGESAPRAGARFNARDRVRRDAHSSTSDTVRRAVASPGQSLDASLQDRYAPRLGRSLRHVRVHTDAEAARSARSIAARAYTFGDHIVFAAGAFAPRTESGRRLLAHELGHIAQGERDIVRRSPAGDAPVEASGEREPVELPEHVSPEIDSLARDTAERIDDVIERDWNGVLKSGLQALLTANDVEDILSGVFEMGHSAQPQLGESNAPVLQYYVAQHPGLRERLALLRRMAGEFNTQRIGRYLDIPVAAGDAYTYEIKLVGASGGEGGEGSRQYVRIRFVEDGKVQWTQSYDFLAGGGGVGAAPGAISGDITWNQFYSAEYWSPDDFVGPMTIIGAGGGIGIGWEVEGATITGNGTHEPLSADIGGFMFTTPEVGVGAFTGKLIPWMGRTPSPVPGPNKPVLPPPPPFVQRPQVHDQITIHFATGQSALGETARRELAAFVSRWKDVFNGGLFSLQLIGYASRSGSTALNQRLSEERWHAVLAAIESPEMLGHPIDESHLATDAVGEQQAVLEGRDKDDDSAGDRVVEVSLTGQRTIPVPSP